MPTTQVQNVQTSNTQNIPSQMQNEVYGGLMGAAGQIVWPGGNFALAPQYSGNLTAPQGLQTQGWYNTVNNMKPPDYGGVMDINSQLQGQAYNRMWDVGGININGNYNQQQINVPQFQMNDPFAGYNGGGPGLQIQAPGGVGGSASNYQTQVQQVQAPQGVTYDKIGNIPQLQAPDLKYFQAQGPEQVSAPNLQNFQMQAAKDVAPQAQVSTQSWTAPGTSQQYMSPYTQQVLDAQKANMTADYNRQLTQQHAQAAQAGAFGGSRQAVEDAEATRNLNLQMQNVEAQGLQQAYQQGAQQFNTEQQQGLQAQQFNVGTGLQASLANQANQQQANVQNLSSFLQTQGLGAQTGLQAGMANQQAGLQTNLANLQANQATQGLGAQLGMQAQQGNQQMSFAQQQANQQAGLQAGMFNNTQNMTAQQLNQAANLQAGLNATNLGFQGATFNAGQNMQAQLANQQAQQAQFQRQFGALGQQYQGNLQSGLQTQNLGMTAQQLQQQGLMFGAGLDLQAQTAQQSARQAAQNSNLNYMQFGAGLNQANAGLMTQGFNNTAVQAGLQQNAAVNQQGYDQAAADRAYQYWQQQNAFPYQQLDWYANLAKGMPAQGSVQTTQQGTQYNITPNPSLFNTVVGGLASGAGAAMMAAEGGLITDEDPPRYAEGGLAAPDLDFAYSA